uniref:transmembrane protein 181-like isoform X2 n=1 Tax=Ciona intestinalis TaxID=7719 RepID=UPI00089DB862|nr:transmembrane protein 181-like isoform X2 [Ciona intestinalis]|eukprot:XP_018667761.1 transmembrane protein 181-like isoform X2 [Ciona intestinalis]
MMSEFLDGIDSVYLREPTLYEKILDYKTAFSDAHTYFKHLMQELENYIVPETVVMDRFGCKPKGRSIQMRLYSLSKRQFVLVFFTFIAGFLLSVFTGFAGPAIISTTHVNTSHLSEPPTSIASGPFKFFSPVLSTFNQQIWLLANLHIQNPTGATFGQPFQLSVTMFAIGEDGAGSAGLSVHVRERTLLCHGQGWCEPIVVLHLGYLEYTKFRVSVSFDGLQNISYPVNDVQFEFKTYNPVFTQVEVWFRFAFLVATFIVTCLFAHTLRKYHMQNWTIEQKWMSFLLPLLLLYNDPIFPLGFLVKSWVPGILDTVFQAAFLCTLLLFWLCAFHGIRSTSEKRPFLTFYLPKVLLCGLVWLAAVTLGSWQQYNELLDPTYQYRIDMKNFLGMKVFFFIIGSVYIMYLVFLLIRACTELHTKPYFNLRLKFLTGITACVIAVSVAIVVLRFGSQVLQDNFVAQISTKYQNSAEFVCFYALLNFYTYTMAFVYSPSQNYGTEPYFRADTGFTLVNDSDEDVIYGNYEEMPLTNGVHKMHKYDSD